MTITHQQAVAAHKLLAEYHREQRKHALLNVLAEDHEQMTRLCEEWAAIIEQIEEQKHRR